MHEKSVIAEVLEVMDRNDMRMFQVTDNGTCSKTATVPAENVTTDKTMVAARWKKHFETLINGNNEGVG